MKPVRDTLAIVQPEQREVEILPERPKIALPAHVRRFLTLLQTHFAYAADGRDWDIHDERDYGRQVIALTGSQCREVFAKLRERHEWRPSVSAVRAVVEEVTRRDMDNLPTYARQAARSVESLRSEAASTLLALPTPPTRPGVETFRETVASLRSGMSIRDRIATRRLAEERNRDELRKHPPTEAEQEDINRKLLMVRLTWLLSRELHRRKALALLAESASLSSAA